MAQDNTSVSADILYPIIKFSAVVLPGQSIPARIDMSPDLAKALKASGDRIFIQNIDANLEEGEIGTFAIIRQKKDPHDGIGGIVATVDVQSRGRLLESSKEGQATLGKVAAVDSVNFDSELVDLAKTTVAKFIQCFGNIFDESGDSGVLEQLPEIAEKDPLSIAYKLAQLTGFETEQRKKLLETIDPKEQLNLIYGLFVEAEVALKAEADAMKQRDDYMLRQQRSVIDKKLGNDDEDEIEELKKRVKEAGMPKKVREKCEKELRRLGRAHDSEKGRILDWLETMLSIPWNKSSETEKDMGKIAEVLDTGIYGLEEVKEFVLDDAAVQLHTGKPSGAVINLNGPPGVGKTAVGVVIAKALDREFVCVSLGGVHDEAEIRGHRTTYVGAIMGRIMKAFQEAGTDNPIIQLDEVDKMGGEGGLNGAPAAALLEVLDPKQNHRFVDHYTGVEYDASKAMYLCSTNDRRKMPAPLYDRVENFDIDGYDDDQKMEIAKGFLVKEQMENCKLTDSQFSITDAALAKVIEGYTYEAGVRSLERLIRKLARKAVRKIEGDKVESVKITPENLEEYLGPKKIERELVNTEPRVGHMNGLAVSGATGMVMEIEATTYEDPKGGIEATGNLMETMADSVRYSDAFVKSHASEFGIPKEDYLSNTLHVKAGKGGVPKDGPSAGLVLATLNISARTGIAIRGDVAMTGEISVLGESGPIGGLKQKLDGAFKAGIRTVIIPVANLKDFDDPKFPAKLKENLEIMPDANAENLGPVPEGKMRIIPVKNEMEVLPHALVRMPEPLPVAETPAAGKSKQELLEGIDANDLRSLLALARAFAQVAPPAPANDIEPQPAARHPRPAVVSKARNVSP